MLCSKRKFLSTTEASRLLEVSVGTVQKMVEAGLLQSWKTQGGHRRISLDSITKLLSQKQNIRDKHGNVIKVDKFEVVVVDDDLLQHKIITQALKGLAINLTLIPIFNGLDALVHLSTQMPQLLILDLDLPIFSGQEVMTLLSDYNLLEGRGILVISGAEDLDTGKLINQSAIRFIKKPINPNWLNGYVAALIDQYQF